jgi:ATP-dependent RNA helicase DDX5/DBP2
MTWSSWNGNDWKTKGYDGNSRETWTWKEADWGNSESSPEESEESGWGNNDSWKPYDTGYWKNNKYGDETRKNDWGYGGDNNPKETNKDYYEEEEFEPIDWSVVLPTLPVFDKDFYLAHPDVEGRSDGEVSDILLKNKIQVLNLEGTEGRPVPKPVTNLIEASFPEYITGKLCNELGGPQVEPTAVQKLLWPIALSGRDCVAIAPTGTGKTLGYLLPAIVHISAQEPVKPSDGSPIVLVVAPTRELAQQIMEQAILYGSAITDLGAQALRPQCVYGGVRKREQQDEFQTNCPDLLVATPGRLLDLLRDGTVNLRRVTYFVVDEVDRLIALDGAWGLTLNDFVRDMEFVSSLIRPDRQCVMCSATCTTEVLELGKKLCGNEPVMFQVGEADQANGQLIVSQNVEQQFARVGNSEWERIQFLIETVLPDTFSESLARSEQKVIVFCNSQRKVDKVTENLREAGWPAVGVHAGKVQEEREWIFSNFKSGACNILVATDVMGRGMDFENVRCVVNFELPPTIQAFIHRVGRTGRIGKKVRKGYALSFITDGDKYLLPELAKMLETSGLDVPDLLRPKQTD